VARVYFNTVLGALGGLLGWVLFSIFGDARASEQAFAWRLLLDGAFIGGGIGYLVVSVEAVLDRSWLRFARLSTYGVVLGALGGAVGLFVAERVNFWLVNLVKDSGPGLRFLAQVFARALGFVFLGLAVGFSEGVAARSLGRMSYGTIGGGLGGFLGGASFGAVYLLTVRPEPSGTIATGLSNPTTALAGAVGLVILGACIGALSALVKDVFQPASLRVLRGWQEGREYPLDKVDTLVGRDEHADIALFRDMRVEKRHVIIQRDGGRYLLLNNGAPPEHTLVNDAPVAQLCELHDGDRIRLGNIVLRFQLRAAAGRGRASGGRQPPVARRLESVRP